MDCLIVIFRKLSLNLTIQKIEQYWKIIMYLRKYDKHYCLCILEIKWAELRWPLFEKWNFPMAFVDSWIFASCFLFPRNSILCPVISCDLLIIIMGAQRSAKKSLPSNLLCHLLGSIKLCWDSCLNPENSTLGLITLVISKPHVVRLESSE